jgi:hypothetical protein
MRWSYGERMFMHAVMRHLQVNNLLGTDNSDFVWQIGLTGSIDLIGLTQAN